jgi:spermidine synthase
VIPWEKLGAARAPDGGELVLYQRGGEFVIRVDGRELMSSRAHGSEERMAELTCAELSAQPRVLIGGLGMGFTLAATLRCVPPSAQVTVAELVPAVVEWNRGPLAPLAGRPLEDPRVTVDPRDVGAVLRAATSRFDVIMYDVDNGPNGLTRKSNNVLYSDQGLALVKRTLRPRGVFAVWSAAPDAKFEARLRRAGFAAKSHGVPARGSAGGPMHTIFIGVAEPVAK